VQFLFDFLSPYSYLAWKRVHALAAPHDRTVTAVPVLLAALLHHHGYKGPAEIPSKRMHMAKQLIRISAREGIPLVPPPAHPFNPVAALSVACLDHSDQRRIIDVLFDAVWARGPGVADPTTVARVLDAAGFPGESLVAAGKEGRRRLRASTTAAIEAGVFGVPTILVDGELFWGFDAFPDVDRFLADEDIVDPAALQRWRDLPVGAVRPRALPGV
jgi:2-hydroxychromene-2-carboxylate isomerase